jgi:hypothetical protein
MEIKETSISRCCQGLSIAYASWLLITSSDDEPITWMKLCDLASSNHFDCIPSGVPRWAYATIWAWLGHRYMWKQGSSHMISSFSPVTTRKRLTAGTLKRLTAGVFAFAGDNLAGGNALPLALSFSPVVTCYYPRRLRTLAGGICYHRHISHICRRQQYIFKELKKN